MLRGMALLPRSEWKAVQLRLTVFPSRPQTPNSVAEWWEVSVGAEPDDVTVNLKKSVGSAVGAYAGGKLTLECQASRIDWRLDPHDVEVESLISEPRIPDLGPYADLIGPFSAVGRAWLGRPDVPEIFRLAFGAVLVHPEPTREAGYARLPEYLPVRVDPGSSDFQYQINYPAASRTAPGVTINRLSKWSVVKLNVARFLAIPGEPPLHSQQAPAVNAFRLELDINTAPSSNLTLPSNSAVGLFEELIETGARTIDQGEQVQ
jgi:hypothetical protein